MTWRRSVSVRGYLVSLVVMFAAVSTALAVYDRSESVSDARRITAERIGFQADLAAKELDRVITETIGTVGAVATNPAIAQLLEPNPECQLTFTSAGHIDIVRADGAVLCSSADPPGNHAGADWLDEVGDEPRASGPVLDPTTGKETLLVSAPLASGGAVATFIELDDVPTQMTDRFGGPLRAEFRISPDPIAPASHRIARSAALETIDWNIEASVPASLATQDINDLNRRKAMFLIAGLVVLSGAAAIVYRGLARPIRQLDTWVQGVQAGDTSPPPNTSGPSELITLAETFEVMRGNVASELEARSQAEREASAAAESYRRLFDSNPQPMWVHDRQTGVLLDVNRAMVERFGWSREQLLDMHVDDVIPVDTDEELSDRLRDVDPLERVGPVRLHDARGEDVDCEISSSILRLDGADTRLVIAEDVTQHLRTQRLVRRADRMDSLGHLAGGMAHDFNNALAVILSYAEFAEEELTRAAAEDPARWESARSDVHNIGVAGQRAAGLTRQLLAFARGEPAVSKSIDLNAVVRELSDMLDRTLGERVDLRLALAPDLGPLRGDPSHLEQIIVNLAVNARDAMPDGGVLSIETSAVEVDEHNTAARPDLQPGPHVRLRVSDTGTGMDAATQELALEPFFTTKPRGAGTGLGLATIYGIITRMGGSIQIYSEPGLGTSVSVMFPAGSAADAETAAAPPGAAGRGQGETVLIIDDDDDIRSVAERILVRAGFDVITAADGDQGLALAAERPGEIDLVLTDVVMPGMLGTELGRRLRRAQPDIQVLFMSGYAPPVALDGEALDDDMVVLDKPFSAASLVEKVTEVLARRVG